MKKIRCPFVNTSRRVFLFLLSTLLCTLSLKFKEKTKNYREAFKGNISYKEKNPRGFFN